MGDYGLLYDVIVKKIVKLVFGLDGFKIVGLCRGYVGLVLKGVVE